MAALPVFIAQPAALGPNPLHPLIYSSQPTVLVMREKVLSLSGDDFTVRTVDGADVVKVKGKAISPIHDTKKFTTADGQDLFKLSNKVIALHKSFHGESAIDAKHNFEIKGHMKLIGSKSTVHFINASTGTEVELVVKGKWLERHAEITYLDQPIAVISRDFINARQVIGDKQTYAIAVAPNVDLSLIAAICAALDEQDDK